MFIVLAIVVCSWYLANNSPTERVIVSLSVGLVTSYIVAVIASLPPIIEFPLNDNEALRVYPQIAYPFCIQQYRNYTANLFRYSVNFGWPEGIPLLQFTIQEDQSHFIHYQRYLSGYSLGLILLLGMTVLVGVLYLIDKRVIIERKQSKASISLLVTLQVFLLILISFLYLSGNIIYPIGGIITLLITLYPTYRVRYLDNQRLRSNGGPEAI